MKQLMDFTGKVAIVTGARAGIGKACAIAFAEQGAKVVLVSRRACQETLDEIEKMGGEATIVCGDMSVEADVKKMVEQTVEKYGRLDYAINAAGITVNSKPLCEQTEQDFDSVVDVDAKGVFLCMKHQIPEMLKVGGGAIVNIASVAGVIADPGMASYVAAKHAVVGLTRSAGIEMAEQNVRVNCICPGLTLSEMTSFIAENEEICKAIAGQNFQKRMANPEEIAGPALFLCSDMASFINGAILPVDGGQVAH